MMAQSPPGPYEREPRSRGPRAGFIAFLHENLGPLAKVIGLFEQFPQTGPSLEDRLLRRPILFFKRASSESRSSILSRSTSAQSSCPGRSLRALRRASRRGDDFVPERPPSVSQPSKAVQGRLQPISGRSLVLEEERLEPAAHLGRFPSGGCARPFLAQVGFFSRCGIRCVDLVKLESMPLFLVNEFGEPDGCPRAFLLRFEPANPGGRVAVAQGKGAGEAIDQLKLGAGIEESAVLPLPVDREALLPDLTEIGQPDAPALDPRLALPAARHLPAQVQAHVNGWTAMLRRRGDGAGETIDCEEALDHETIGSLSDPIGVRSLPREEADRVDQDRLPRPGLAGHGIQPRAEGELRLSHDYERFEPERKEQLIPPT